MAILVLVFKKLESEDKPKYDNFYLSSILIQSLITLLVFQSIILYLEAVILNYQKN